MPALPIYLDSQATTPIDPKVVEAMMPYFTNHYGNPASRQHAFGWAARDAVEHARRQVAEFVDCDPREVCFTSGATEANNLAIKGIVGATKNRHINVVTLATEHRAVLDPCRKLEALGVQLTVVSTDRDGLVNLQELERALTPNTVLISVMAANNEIGVLQPISEISEMARDRNIVFHSDAVQAVGKVPFSIRKLGVDLISLSGHKIYGPKGIGALCFRRRRRTPLDPQMDGGGHERGLRSGTLNVPGIVGLGCAAAICQQNIKSDSARMQTLRDRLLNGLRQRLDLISVNGSMEHRLPNNINVSFHGVEGSSLIVGLDDIAVSSGSACTSSHPEPSHVLRAIGIPDEHARAALRFGLNRWTSPDEIDYTIEKVTSLVTRLRQVSS